MKEEDHLKNPGVEGRIFERLVGRANIGSICLQIGYGGGLL
jgi:hypothetical protein